MKESEERRKQNAEGENNANRSLDNDLKRTSGNLVDTLKGVLWGGLMAGMLGWCPGTGRGAIYTENYSSGAADWVGTGSAMVFDWNTSGYLQGVFGELGVPAPQSGAFRASAAASSGAFAGNYWTGLEGQDGFHGWSFSLNSFDITPSSLVVRFGDAEGMVWFTTLTPASQGNWATLSTPGLLVGFGGSGWVGGDMTLAGLSNSLASVSWVEVQVERSGTGAQTYGLDNFRYTGMFGEWGGGLRRDGQHGARARHGHVGFSGCRIAPLAQR